jgi:hypothetical protein
MRFSCVLWLGSFDLILASCQLADQPILLVANIEEIEPVIGGILS